MKAHSENAKAAGGILLLYIVLESIGITCPIKYLTGISCAGCGMSRAWMAVFRGDFAAAYSFHPLFWLPCAAAVLYAARRKIPVRIYKGCWIGVVMLAMSVYLVRMLNPGDTVVAFHPEEGALAGVIRAAVNFVKDIVNLVQ